MAPTPQMMAGLHMLASALLETLNDKNIALCHQRKTNKSVPVSDSSFLTYGSSEYSKLFYDEVL